MEEKTNVMSQEELNELYEETGLTEADLKQMLLDSVNGEYLPLDEAFAELDRRIAEKRRKFTHEMYFKKAV